MKFIKWLINQYRVYQLEQSLPKKSQSEKDCAMMNAYYRCIEAGFTTEQMNALVTFISNI